MIVSFGAPLSVCAAPSDDAERVAIVIESLPPSIDPGELREAVRHELAASTVDAASRSGGTLSFRFEGASRVNVTFRANDGATVTRSIDVPSAPHEALAVLAYLAGNLARDELAELLVPPGDRAATVAPSPSGDRARVEPPTSPDAPRSKEAKGGKEPLGWSIALLAGVGFEHGPAFPFDDNHNSEELSQAFLAAHIARRYGVVSFGALATLSGISYGGNLGSGAVPSSHLYATSARITQASLALAPSAEIGLDLWRFRFEGGAAAGLQGIHSSATVGVFSLHDTAAVQVVSGSSTRFIPYGALFATLGVRVFGPVDVVVRGQVESGMEYVPPAVSRSVQDDVLSSHRFAALGLGLGVRVHLGHVE